jgi:hypothetical protein
MSDYNPFEKEFDDPENEEWTEIEGTVIKETPATDKSEGAIYVDFEDGLKEWLPKSQLDDWPDEGDTGLIRMKTWLAEEKGLV